MADWNLDTARHAVSRMAAVLVMAAGGKIRVPLTMIRKADDYRLHQDDSEYGFVTYSSHDRRPTPAPAALTDRMNEGGEIIDVTVRKVGLKSEDVVRLVVERAEQACRYTAKHNEDNQEGDYANGFADACSVCEAAIRRYVERFIEKDLEEASNG